MNRFFQDFILEFYVSSIFYFSLINFYYFLFNYICHYYSRSFAIFPVNLQFLSYIKLKEKNLAGLTHFEYYQINQDHHWQIVWINVGIYWSRRPRGCRKSFSSLCLPCCCIKSQSKIERHTMHLLSLLKFHSPLFYLGTSKSFVPLLFDSPHSGFIIRTCGSVRDLGWLWYKFNAIARRSGEHLSWNRMRYGEKNAGDRIGNCEAG